MKCSCHTIELCINYACKEENIIKINKASDSVIKLLRTPFMTDTLEKCGHHRPTISCTTRWHSLFDSLSSLLNLKEFCIKNQGSIKELFLSESEWSDINLWKNALQPFSQCITLMQNEQMTMSDFYGLYVLLLANLDSVDNIYSKLLTEILNKRCNNIINTELMRGCIYLDPRFQAFLDEKQRQGAISYLAEIYNYYCNMTTDVKCVEIKRNMVLKDSNNILQSLRDIMKENNNYKKKNRKEDIEYLLLDFEFVDEIDINQSILNYWEANKYLRPQLYFISQIIYAVPPTEASVERAFSILKFVYSDQREKLDMELLEDILTINLNNDNFKVLNKY